MDGTPDLHDPTYRCSLCTDLHGIRPSNCTPPEKYAYRNPQDSAHVRPTGPAGNANPLISLPEIGRRDWIRTNLDGDSRGLQGEKANGTDPQ